MRPLYPGGPGFGFPGPSGLDWPHSHGLQDDVTLSMARDLRLFSCYFVVAESLATFLGYRIAQHCIRGCRVYFLSPSQRMWIGFVYCWLKIRLVRCFSFLKYEEETPPFLYSNLVRHCYLNLCMFRISN